MTIAEQAPETTAPTKDEPTLSERIEQALADYRNAERELAAYTEAHAEVFLAIEVRKEEVDICKAAILDLLTEHELDYAADGQIEASVVVSDRGRYVAERLPKTVAVLDACELTIDTKTVRNLIRRGLLSKAEAEAAWESRPAKPYVRLTPIKDAS